MEQLNFHWFYILQQGAGQRPLVDGLAIFFADGGPYLMAFGLVVFWLRAQDARRSSLLEATEASLLGLLVNQLLGLLFYYPRPYMLGLVTPLVAHGPENSFPSDHATLMLTAALYLLFRRGWRGPGLLLLGMALVTAWGRVYAGIHFPFDMLGSLLVALLCSGLVLWRRSLLAPLNHLLLQFYHRLNNGLASCWRQVKG